MTKKKKPIKKEVLKKYRKPSKRQVVVGAFCFLLVLFGIYYINRQIKISNEKKRLDQTKQHLGKISDEIVATLGIKPTRMETIGLCGRTGEKFSKGRLYCGTRSGANFDTDSDTSAKALGELILASITKETQSQKLTSKTEREGFFDYGYSIELQYDKCGLSINYDNEGTFSNKEPGQSMPGTVGYQISCTMFTHAEHYPLIK